MNRLYILRHARAMERAASGRDFDRQLAPAGHAQCARLHALFENGELTPPRHVYCSPAARAVETARGVLGAALAQGMRQDERIYDARVSDLLEVLSGMPADGPAILVGHNPGLEGLLRWLTGDGAARGLQTATLAEVETREGHAPGAGRLVRVLYADALPSAST